MKTPITKRTRAVSFVIACALLASSVACGDPLESGDGPKVDEPTPSASLSGLAACDQNLSSYWGAINDIAGVVPSDLWGAVPGFGSVFKYVQLYSKVAQRFACSSGQAAMAEAIERIAHKTVNDALATNFKAQLAGISDLLQGDPSPDLIVKESTVGQLVTIEQGAAATGGFEAVPTVIGAATLKLSIRHALLDSASTGGEYHRQFVNALNDIRATETALDNVKKNLDDFLKGYSAQTTHYVDNEDAPYSDDWGVYVVYPDGTTSETTWYECSPTLSDNCRQNVKDRANSDLASSVASAQKETRDRILGENYKTLRQNITNFRDGLLKHAARMNLAYNRPTQQSSDNYGGGKGASRLAVDGNPNGDFNGGSVTHTKSLQGASWEVDLGRTQAIETVAIHNRTDCCSERLNGFKVELLDEQKETVWKQVVSAAKDINYVSFRPGGDDAKEPAKSGRHVRITLEGTNFLSLAEVYVFGANRARLKPSTQSSTYDGGVASRAVDGNASGAYGAGSVTQTTNQSHAFWEVDLGVPQPIGEVVLYNRTDCCADRLSHFQVQLRDKTGNVLARYRREKLVEPIGHIPFGGTQAQVIRVELIDANFLSLAEVEVLSPRDAH